MTDFTSLSERPKPLAGGGARVLSGDVIEGEIRAAVRLSPFMGPTDTIVAPEGASLAEMAMLAIADAALRAHLVAVVDGEEVARSAWRDVRPRAGQSVVFAVRPGDSGGGGGGQSDTEKWVRTIFAIAVLALSTWVSQGAWTPATLEWAAPFLGAGVAIAGNLAINALIPLERPQFGANSSDPYYSITGARNQALPWQPVPIVFGKHRWAPPMWGRPVQEVVSTTPTPSSAVWVRQAFALGPAPVQVSEIRIGETPISEYADLVYELRTHADDPPHRLYTGDPDQTAVGAKLTLDFTSQTTAADVDEIDLLFGARQGIGGIDGEGKQVNISVPILVEWRLAGDEAAPWSDVRANSLERVIEAAETAGYPDLSAVPTSGTEAAEFWVAFKDALDDVTDAYAATVVSGTNVGRYPVHMASRIPGQAWQKQYKMHVPRGQYEVRARRTTAETEATGHVDGVWWEAIGSRRSWVDPFPEPRCASLVIHARGSDRLSGVIETLNLVQESLVPVFSTGAKAEPWTAVAGDLGGETASRNPSELALWSCRGPHAAIPKPDSEIDWPAWAAFAAFCEDEGLHYDQPVLQPQTRGETLRRICAAGYGAPVKIGGKLSVVVDKPRTGEAPSQVFTPRNVSGFRLTKSFPAEVHALRVGFANADNGWQADEVVIYADGYAKEAEYDGETLVKAAATRYETLDIPGKTDPDEVREVARRYFNNALTQTERFTFDMDVEHLTCTLGAYVLAQHDVMAVGIGSARVREVILDEGDVTGFILDAPVATETGVTLGARWRYVKTIAGDAWLEAANEVAITRDADNPAAFSLVTPAAEADAPAVGDLVVIGETAKVAYECLVRAMEPSAGDRARITLVAYAPERFTPDGTPLPPHDPLTDIPIGSRPATPVLLQTNASAREISVSFTQPASPRGVVLRGYECAIREHAAAVTGDDGLAMDVGAWTALPGLEAGAQTCIAPPGDPNKSYDIRIVALGSDAGGLPVRSDPLLVEDIEAEAAPAAPAGVSAAFATRTSPSGVKQIVLEASWTPNLDPDVVDTRIELLTAAGPPATFVGVGGARASVGAAEVHGLQVGRSYTFGFVNVTRRGAESERTLFGPVSAADILVASEAHAAAAGSVLAGEIQALETEVGGFVAADIVARLTAADGGSAMSQTVEQQVAGLRMAVLPDRVSVAADFIDTPTTDGTPADKTPIASGTVVSAGAEGDVRQFTTVVNVGTLDWHPVDAGWTYEVRARAAVTVDGVGNRLYIGFPVFEADGNYLGTYSFNTVDSGHTVADGWKDYALQVTGAAILGAYPLAKFVRGRVTGGRNSGGTASGATWRLASLRFTADDPLATVTETKRAVTDVEGSAAFWELVTEAAGSDLAAVRLRAGKDGSFLELISTVLRLANITNGAVIEVMRAEDGEAYFSRPISSDFGGRRLTVGPGFGVTGQEVVLWFGPDTLAPSAQSRTNGYLALGTDGFVYDSSRLTATVSNTLVSSDRDQGPATTDSVTVTATGGTAPYVYRWRFVPFDGFGGPTSDLTISSATAVTVDWDGVVVEDAVINEIWECAVTDANGRTAFTRTTVELFDADWEA